MYLLNLKGDVQSCDQIITFKYQVPSFALSLWLEPAQRLNLKAVVWSHE